MKEEGREKRREKEEKKKKKNHKIRATYICGEGEKGRKKKEKKEGYVPNYPVLVFLTEY